MAENNNNNNNNNNNDKRFDLKMKSGYEYSLLYYYVSALKQLISKKGEGYEKAKKQFPDLDDRLSKGKNVKNYNDILMDCKTCFPGLNAVSREDLKYYATRAHQLGGGNFPPSLEDVDKAKAKYDQDLSASREQGNNNCKKSKEDLKKAQKALGKARLKSLGAWGLGALATVGTVAGVGLFGSAVGAVLSTAVTGVAGLASGAAVVGVALALFGAKWIFKGISKMFKGIKNLIQKRRQERKAQKEICKKLREAHKKNEQTLDAYDKRINLDNYYEKNMPYPGKNLAKDIELENIEEQILVHPHQVVQQQQAQQKGRDQQDRQEYYLAKKQQFKEFKEKYKDPKELAKLDPKNPQNKEILNYFEEEQKFFSDVNKKFCNENGDLTTSQIEARYSKELVDIMEDFFQKYKIADSYIQEKTGLSTQDLREDAINKCISKLNEQIRVNFKEFENTYNVQVPESIKGDPLKSVVMDKYIERVEDEKSVEQKEDNENAQELNNQDFENVFQAIENGENDVNKIADDLKKEEEEREQEEIQREREEANRKAEEAEKKAQADKASAIEKAEQEAGRLDDAIKTIHVNIGGLDQEGRTADQRQMAQKLSENLKVYQAQLEKSKLLIEQMKGLTDLSEINNLVSEITGYANAAFKDAEMSFNELEQIENDRADKEQARKKEEQAKIQEQVNNEKEKQQKFEENLGKLKAIKESFESVAQTADQHLQLAVVEAVLESCEEANKEINNLVEEMAKTDKMSTVQTIAQRLEEIYSEQNIEQAVETAQQYLEAAQPKKEEPKVVAENNNENVGLTYEQAVAIAQANSNITIKAINNDTECEYDGELVCFILNREEPFVNFMSRSLENKDKFDFDFQNTPSISLKDLTEEEFTSLINEKVKKIMQTKQQKTEANGGGDDDIVHAEELDKQEQEHKVVITPDDLVQIKSLMEAGPEQEEELKALAKDLRVKLGLPANAPYKRIVSELEKQLKETAGEIHKEETENTPKEQKEKGSSTIEQIISIPLDPEKNSLHRFFIKEIGDKEQAEKFVEALDDKQREELKAILEAKGVNQRSVEVREKLVKLIETSKKQAKKRDVQPANEDEMHKNKTAKEKRIEDGLQTLKEMGIEFDQTKMPEKVQKEFIESLGKNGSVTSEFFKNHMLSKYGKYLKGVPQQEKEEEVQEEVEAVAGKEEQNNQQVEPKEKKDKNQLRAERQRQEHIENLRKRGYDLPDFENMSEEMKNLVIYHGGDVNYMRKHLKEDFGIEPNKQQPINKEQEIKEEVQNENQVPLNVQRVQTYFGDEKEMYEEFMEKHGDKISNLTPEQLKEMLNQYRNDRQKVQDEDELGK